MSHALQQPEAVDPLIGLVIQDRYRVGRKLGDGGMGAVYEGEHIVIKRRVAIKVLHAQFAHNPEIVARFQREAEAATRIGHPNIIEVTDMGRFPNGTAYMVLEFLEGRDFAHDIKQQGPQPLGKVVHIISQVCEALDAAHHKGIVHRDLKPENIFLIERRGDPNFAKVLDFGISKIADSANQDRSLTQTGTALGTPYYMAPEQCQGKKDLDPRADIYALGVILFQALTAQYPFDDESYPMLVLKICTEPPPPLSRYRPDLPPPVVEIVNRMLAKQRENRFMTCAEVAVALAPYAAMHDAPVIAADAPRTSEAGVSVLAGAAGPAMTPSGTAYLPSSSPSLPSAPAAPASSSSSGLVLAIVGILALLVLSGGAIGTAVALGVFSSSHAEPVPTVASTPPEPGSAEPGSAEPGSAEPGVPPPAEVTAAAVAPVAEPPEAPALVSVSIRAMPSQAVIELDGEPRENPFDGEVRPGVHHLVVRAEGYVTHESHPDLDHQRALPIMLERASRAHTSTSQTARPPAPVVTPMAPAPSRGGGGIQPVPRRGTSPPLMDSRGVFGR